MSNDISTMYAREENQKNGRKGYLFWSQEKIDGLPPNKYGSFVTAHKKGRKKHGKRS